MSRKHARDPMAERPAKRVKSDDAKENETVKLKELMAACFRNDATSCITWIAHQVFEDHMHQISQDLLYNPESVSTIMFCSPCRFTRSFVATQAIELIKTCLEAKHYQLHFKYSPNMVKGVAELIETRKEMDEKIKTWCSELLPSREITIRDEGISRLPVRGVMVLEIPEAHAYTPTELEHKLKLLHGALFKHQGKGSKVLIVLQGNYAPQKIKELADEARKENPPALILTHAESKLDIRPDPWSHSTAAYAIENLLRTTLPCNVYPLPTIQQDTLAFYYAARLRDKLYSSLHKFADKVVKPFVILPADAPSESDTEDEDEPEDFPVNVPMEVGFVLSHIYPANEDDALSRFFAELERITSRLRALAEERHKARQYFQTCSVSITDEKSLDFFFNTVKIHSFVLPKPWPFDNQTLDSTREHVKELQATHNWEISDNCIDAISHNVSIMSGNTGDAAFRNQVAQKAILDNASPFLQNAVVRYNPQNSVLSLSQNHISFGHAIINILSDQQRRIAEIEAKQKEQDIEQKRLAAEVREIKQERQMIPRNRNNHAGPRAGSGGIYLRSRPGQRASYLIQYRSQGAQRVFHISTRVIHGDSPKETIVKELRRSGSELGLSDDVIQRSLIRLDLL